MTLQQMRYFIGAAESGSISEAAKRSFTAQSSISGAIKEVENTYGITAFVRDSKGVRLTRSGEELLIEADSVVCALGYRSEYDKVDALCEKVDESYVIGDCSKVGLIYHAVNQGYYTAVRL